MKKTLALIIALAMVLGTMSGIAFAEETTKSGTYGGIDWTLDADGTLTIAPTKGEPVPDKNAPTKRTYEVGEWREQVVYNSKGSATAIGGAPYDMKAVKKLVIEEGVTTIGSFAGQFPNLSGTVVIPSTVTYIGQEAFHKAPMTELIFAEGGTAPLCIANGAFKKINIEDLVLPADREYIHIHHWVFGGCAKLKTVFFPANVTKLWGGEHVDYFDNFNSQTNAQWGNYSCIFSGDSAIETITFESAEVRDLFFSHDNGVISYSNGSYNGDYFVGSVGLVAYGDNAVDEMAKAVADGGEILLYRPCSKDITTTGDLKITYVNKDAAFTGDVILDSLDASFVIDLPANKTYEGDVSLSGEFDGRAGQKVDADGNIYYVVCDAVLTHEGEDTVCNFDEAIAAAVAGDKITLLADVVYNIGTSTVSTMALNSNSNSVIIDLNGKTLAPADPTIPTFAANETYVIKNGTIEGDVTVEAGTVVVENVSIEGDFTVEGGSVEFTSGAVTGDIEVASGSELVISGGDFSENVTEYAADGLETVRTAYGYTVIAKARQADSISIEYKDITATDAEGEKTYEVYVKANDDDMINELASVDLTFDFATDAVDDGAMNITVLPTADFTMSTAEGDRYMFNYNGVSAVEGTANAIAIATIKVEGYGKFSIATKDLSTSTDDTNIVNATTVNDNLVDSYTAAGGKDSDTTTGALVINKDTDTTDELVGGVANVEIEVPKRTLTVNIAFPNAVENNVKAYQDMTVTIVGGTVNEKIELGTDGEAYSFERSLPYNTAYTVTVSGAGYRTARYTVTLNDNKTLNFWNNVMDEEKEVEVGKANSAVIKNFLAGDIVKDNNINIYDLSAVVSYFATTTDRAAESNYAKYDLNRDGVIDSKDVAYVLVSWNN